MTTNAPRSITEPTITAAQSVAPDQGRKEDTMSEAERLADAIDSEFVKGRITNYTGLKAAIELRRLAAEVEALQKQLGECSGGYQTLQAEVAMLRRKLFATSGKAAPCAACGYNGPGFFQAATHPCAETTRPEGEKT